MKKKNWGLIVLLLLAQFVIAQSDSAFYEDWKFGPDDGIAYTKVNNNIYIFKIDQNKHRFNVEMDTIEYKTLPEYAEWANGGINLNMFTDAPKPNGYTKIKGKVINSDINPKYNAFIVWNRDTLRILDSTKEPIKEILKWDNVSQNIRMVSESGKRNRWTIDNKKWSVATLATTINGDVLFIHSRYPYTMNKFIDILLKEEKLKIYRMVYLEGGMEASMVMYGAISRPLHSSQKKEFIGSYESNVNESYDNNRVFWGLPFCLTFNFK